MDHKYSDEFKIFSRPYTFAMIRQAFSGPWIPQRKKDSIRHFYRPFSIVAYAGLYEVAGQDVTKIHLFKQVFSFIKIAAFFGVIYLLIHSMLAAFFATLAYAVSFKVFEEQIVFQCFPDLLVASYFFSAIVAFILFARSKAGSTENIIAGAFVALLYLLSIGTKESGVFLLPTLAAYWFIYEVSGNPFKAIARRENRKYQYLFALLLYFSCWYGWMRLDALGPAYVLSTSSPYSTLAGPFVFIALNIQNSFALIPWSYIQSPGDSLMASKVLINLLLPLTTLLCCRDRETRRLFLFGLVLIALNTFFYSQAARARFNSIGNLGTFLMVGIIIRRGIENFRHHPQIAIAALPALLCGTYFYADSNIHNILNRQSPTAVHQLWEDPPEDAPVTKGGPRHSSPYTIYVNGFSSALSP